MQEVLNPSSSLQLTPETTITRNGQVFVKCPTNPEEWMYIELQGELQSTTKGEASLKGPLSGTTGSHLYNLSLGLMTFDGSSIKMQIGNMLLTGKKVKLTKPLMILLPESENVLEEGTQSENSLTEKSKSLHVQGIIRHKYVFDKRPTPIITLK